MNDKNNNEIKTNNTSEKCIEALKELTAAYIALQGRAWYCSLNETY